MTIASRQGHSDNPFSYAFWLGGIDPRPAALFRIALGLTILHDLLDLTRDLRAFLTDEGMLPRGTFSGPYAWTCFDWVGSPLAVSALYAVGFGTVVAFTLGYATRAATIATWLFVSSLHHRNNYVTDGGDDVVRILLFWSIFANLGAAYSVDARRAATRVISVPALPVRILQLQIAVLYFAAARLKFRLGWLHGDQIFYALQLDGFARPPGTFLTRFPSLCRLATKAILGMEFLFAFAAFSPVAIRFSRTVAIALGLAIQLGILTTMRVGIFTEAMLSVVWLFVLPEWIDAAEAWARKRYRLATDARPSSVVESPRWRVALNAFVLLQFVAAIWGVVAARRFPLPKVVAREIKLLDVEAKYSLFDVTYAIPRWEAPGLLADGTPVEVLSVVAPGAMPRGPNVRFSRWNKLTFKEREFPFYPELGAYFCRKYDEVAEPRSRTKLASFTLVDHMTPPRPPVGQSEAPTDRILLNESCP